MARLKALGAVTALGNLGPTRSVRIIIENNIENDNEEGVRRLGRCLKERKG